MMKISFREPPQPEAMKIVKMALTEAISPVDFCKELEKVGVSNDLFHVYLTNFFGIDCITARDISLKIRFGGTKAWRNYSNITDDKIAIMYVPLKARTCVLDE